jgi:hypothetical protein
MFEILGFFSGVNESKAMNAHTHTQLDRQTYFSQRKVRKGEKRNFML